MHDPHRFCSKFQRTWEERQNINQIAVKNSFAKAVAGTLDHDYFFNQAKVQYLQNPEKAIDVVVFQCTPRRFGTLAISSMST